MPNKLHLFQASTLLPAPLARVFPFFADPANLQRLTPSFLGFKILSPSGGQAHAGQVIDYRLRVHGIPLRWRSLISLWEPPHRFVDVAVISPYAFWHHEHSFVAKGKRTLVTDRVHYSLPLGRLGDWVAGGMVKRDVEAIFRYRESVLRQVFGTAKA